MSENDLYPVPQNWARNAWIDNDKYLKLYEASIENPELFWGEQGKRIDWIKPYTKVKDVSYAHDDIHIRWYQDGTLNASVNCLDRHLLEKGDQIAILWEGDEVDQDTTLTYRELHQQVCKFANSMKKYTVVKQNITNSPCKLLFDSKSE